MEWVNGTIKPSQLREIAEHRQACYEVWPDRDGFDVDLIAEAGGLVKQPCAAIYEELKQIAMAALPTDAREAEFDLLPFDNSFHESLHRGFRPEIVLSLRILHKRCLAHIESALKQLGLERAN